MKKLLLLLILIPMLLGATEFTLVGKPGKLLIPGGVVSLVCEHEYCFYDLDFPNGNYYYESNDGDTCIITVNDPCPVISSNDEIVEIIQY